MWEGENGDRRRKAWSEVGEKKDDKKEGDRIEREENRENNYGKEKTVMRGGRLRLK